MNNTIQYKGYLGSVEFSEEDGIFYGKVMGDVYKRHALHIFTSPLSFMYSCLSGIRSWEFVRMLIIS